MKHLFSDLTREERRRFRRRWKSVIRYSRSARALAEARGLVAPEFRCFVSTRCLPLKYVVELQGIRR